jgi:hypothetical protein
LTGAVTVATVGKIRIRRCHQIEAVRRVQGFPVYGRNFCLGVLRLASRAGPVSALAGVGAVFVEGTRRWLNPNEEDLQGDGFATWYRDPGRIVDVSEDGGSSAVVRALPSQASGRGVRPEGAKTSLHATPISVSLPGREDCARSRVFSLPWS